MIKVKIVDIVNGTEALQKLAKTELKAKLAWQVSKLLKAAEQEIQIFNDTRMSVIKKYGEKDENGELITDDNGNCKISDNNLILFNTELNELLSNEVEINANKLNINDFGDINFTPSEMASLELFIDFDEESTSSDPMVSIK